MAFEVLSIVTNKGAQPLNSRVSPSLSKGVKSALMPAKSNAILKAAKLQLELLLVVLTTPGVVGKVEKPPHPAQTAW